MSITRIGTGPRMSKAVIHGHTVYLSGQVASTTKGGSVHDQTADILAQIDAILKEADTIKRFTELGIEPKVSSPQELGERMKSEIEKWNKVVRNMEPL